jgi:hypothetical protein
MQVADRGGQRHGIARCLKVPQDQLLHGFQLKLVMAQESPVPRF